MITQSYNLKVAGEMKMEKSFITVLKEMFSLKADSASHDEIRDRLIGGGQITGTNMCADLRHDHSVGWT